MTPPWHYVADRVPETDAIRAVAIHYEPRGKTYVCYLNAGPHPDGWRQGQGASWGPRLRYAWRDLTEDERRAYESRAYYDHDIEPPPLRPER